MSSLAKSRKGLVMKKFFLIFFYSFCLTPTIHAGVLLQGFYWDAPSPWENTWWDQLSQESSNLSDSGFTAVWIPPVLKGASGGYSNGYDPFDDYDIGSKDQRSTYGTHWGTREQLMRTVAVLRANGMDVYFDNVLGHRSGDNGEGYFQYKDAYGNANGGRFPKDPNSFSGFNTFGRQVNYSNPYVHEQLIRAGDWLVNAIGTQGMRLDMATNVSPDFLRSYLNTGAMQGQFVVSEYWSENLDELEHYVRHSMQGRVSAFDFPLWGRLKDMTKAKGYYDLRQLITAGLNSRLPQNSVTFVENHDTDRGFPITENKHMAYAYILTNEGYPSVFWKDYFNYGLKNIIDPLIWIHEKFAHGPTLWRYTDPDLLIYERDSKPGLLVGLNDNQSEDKSQWVQTQFGSYVTLHDYTGNAEDIRTEADGRVAVRVPKNSYVAYSPIGFHWGHEKRTYNVSQQFAGASDLDIPPATSEVQTVGRIYVKEQTSIEWTLYYNNLTPQLPLSSGEFHLFLKDPQNNQVVEEVLPLNTTPTPQHYWAQKTGWFEFQIMLKSDDSNTALPYWLDLTYRSDGEWKMENR